MRAPKTVAQESTEGIQLLEIDSVSTIVRDPKQITNYKYNYGKNKDSNADELNNIIVELLSQKQQGAYCVIDKEQPYIREFFLRDSNRVQECFSCLERNWKTSMVSSSSTCAPKQDPRGISAFLASSETKNSTAEERWRIWN
ncbi:uncharacterized protein LOC114539689 [Dendronephthya gigantea]|uniref:uncharacterized protein LOC114539689 n=1 Tax=Dendronephthya gigantea TaxID=151771 RepID=UPI001069B745|nr:uncharacterized protein LOC114539689 [Dendronephthya gigantea]